MLRMKTLTLISMLIISSLAYCQTNTPFDTLQIKKNDLIISLSNIEVEQMKQIDALNMRTKGYVIAVFAEEKPGTKLFIARMEDIKRHRDYTLKKILSEEQYLSYTSKSTYISKSIATEIR